MRTAQLEVGTVVRRAMIPHPLDGHRSQQSACAVYVQA
jgi:hypothetical protein